MASIADLLLAQGQQAAATRERLGQIAGQTWSNIGQTIGQIPQQIQQQKTAALQQQLLGQQATIGGTQISDLKALDAAFSKPGGRDEILNRLPGHLRGTVSKQFSDADESAAKLQEAQLKAEDATSEYVNNLAEGIKFHGYDPNATQLALSHAKSTFRSNPSLLQQVGQLEQQIQGNPTPEAIKAIVDPIMAAHDAKEKGVILPATPRGGAPAQLVRPSGAVLATGSQAPAEPPTAEQVAGIASGVLPGQMPTMPQAQQMVGLTHPQPAAQPKNYRVKGVGDVPLEFLPGRTSAEPGHFFLNQAGGTRKELFPGKDFTDIPSAAAVNIDLNKLTGAALDQNAQKYLETGQLPPGMGMGPQRTEIMNRAAELDPKAALARNQAVFKADSANLTNLQKTEGTLSAFENTAGKNLDQFLSVASKVPDTGVPWLNQPIRAVNRSGLGSADQAAFDAARNVALREISRVTNDPKLSGALTDSARQEVLGLSPANATFAQIKRVAQVLKQDMANVHSGLNEQITQVKQGIGSNPNAPAQPQQAQAPKAPAGWKYVPKAGGGWTAVEDK